MPKRVREIRDREDLVSGDAYLVGYAEIFELSCVAVIDTTARPRVMVARLPYAPHGDHEAITINEMKARVEDLFGELWAVIEALAEVRVADKGHKGLLLIAGDEWRDVLNPKNVLEGRVING